MPVVLSDQIPETSIMREWWYNSLDAAVTYEIFEVIGPRNAGTNVYNFERSMQGPALDMMLRGFLIDPMWRAHSTDVWSKRKEDVEEKLNRLAHSIWGKELNPRSPDQLKEFFFNELQLPEVWISQKGVRKLSTNREALEKLNQYLPAKPFVACIFMAREASKKLSVLKSGVDPDGRMRCSYNVCGTESGRWSSSKNVYGRGGNLQNLDPELRRMFVADPGYILVIIDGEQAESRATGFIQGRLFDDWKYLDACEGGDLHTYVAQLVWPDLGWSADPKENREIADRAFYRWFSYRDMSKRGGHGTNYYGKPHTMARHLKVPKLLIENFQNAYFREFPGFTSWHQWCAHQLGTYQSLTTFMGRTRDFFGRPDDDATLREFIAYEPQSVVADLVNEGGYRVWNKFPEAQILGQYHDAYAFQVPEGRLDLVDQLIKTFEVEVSIPSRRLVIPGEAKVGWNWGEYQLDKPAEKRTFRDGNPDGLRKWKGSETRTRSEDPTASLLDRKLH